MFKTCGPSGRVVTETGARAPGVDHLGIQTDTAEELAELALRLKAAGEVTRDQAAATCCHPRNIGQPGCTHVARSVCSHMPFMLSRSFSSKAW